VTSKLVNPTHKTRGNPPRKKVRNKGPSRRGLRNEPKVERVGKRKKGRVGLELLSTFKRGPAGRLAETRKGRGDYVRRGQLLGEGLP